MKKKERAVRRDWCHQCGRTLKSGACSMEHAKRKYDWLETLAAEKAEKKARKLRKER